MLIVKYGTAKASFDSNNTIWTSDNERGNQAFVEALNDHLPEHSVDSIYAVSKKDKQVTGLDAEALDAIAFLGKKLKVVYFEAIEYNVPDGAIV